MYIYPLDSSKKTNEECMHCYHESCVCENNNCISFNLCSFTTTYEEEQLLLLLDEVNLNDVIEETLKYVARHVAFKFKNKYSILGIETRHMDVAI